MKPEVEKENEYATYRKWLIQKEKEFVEVQKKKNLEKTKTIISKEEKKDSKPEAKVDTKPEEK